MDVDGAHAAIQLPEGFWWDWDVVAWDGGELRLAAGHDLAYHHGLDWSSVIQSSSAARPAFAIRPSGPPSPDELLRITRQLGGKPPIVVAFEADAGGQEPVLCLIAAERLDVVQETVLRCWRDDAGPDQRFAPWVRPPGQ
ncbi:hypothetical protein ACWGJW_23385 [Streptomyces nigrescens]